MQNSTNHDPAYDSTMPFTTIGLLHEKNLISTNPKYPGLTVFAREIDMLKNVGYVQKGDYFIHPSNLK